MSILKDLLAIKVVDESYDVDPEDALAAHADELEAAHAAQAHEYHSHGHSHHVIAHADEFSVELEDDLVHLLDGEGVVRMSMPADVWHSLCRQTCGE